MKAPTKQTWAKLLILLLGIVLIGYLLYQDSWVRSKVVALAGELGEPAVPYLRHALQDENNKVRQQAHLSLVAIGADAVPSLAESLRDGDPKIRLEAAFALCLVGQ